MSSAVTQAPFYLFNQESKSDSRQAQFHTQHQMAGFQMVHALPPTPMYSRPNSSSCSQPPTLYSNGPAVMTPTGPVPTTAQRPVIMLDTDFTDNSYFPSTPPLSTSGSAVGSPKLCDALQTPMNPMFSGLDGLTACKDGLESAENLVLDWSSCASPPMSPGRWTSP